MGSLRCSDGGVTVDAERNSVGGIDVPVGTSFKDAEMPARGTKNRWLVVVTPLLSCDFTTGIVKLNGTRLSASIPDVLGTSRFSRVPSEPLF